ncbi:MAG: MFS transporter [Pelagibacterium sp. SCN 63-23]|nr:MAG: MFS transporter [Pelagibacterium sp. SCN 63-23]
MASVIKIYALFLGSALLMFGGGLQGLLLSVRGAEENFSLLALGLIGTGWSVGFISGSLFVPLIVRKVGHIRAFSVMAAIGTITILLNLLWINDVSWIVLRALSGFCFAGAAMIVESWLNEVADNKSRGTIFSIYTTINMASSTMGQIAMSVTGTAGYIPFVIGAISFICAVLPTSLTSSPQPRPLTSAKLDLPLLIRTSPVAAVAAFCCGMTNGAFGTLAPVYGYEQGLDASGIALLFAIAAVAGAIGQIPFGRLSDRLDRRQVMIGLGAGAALVGLTVVLLNPGPGWVMFSLFALYGLAANPLYPIAVAHANDFARDGEFAKVAGGMLLIYGTGLALGPTLASVLMGAIAPMALFMVTALFHALVAGFAFLRMRARRSIDASERAPFQPMGPETPETVALDPRADSDAATPATDREAPVPDELMDSEGNGHVQGKPV